MNNPTGKYGAPDSNTHENLQHFAYIAAHELQEPLRAISSFIDLLEKNLGPKLTDEERSWLGETVSGADRMRNLIHALLAFSKADLDALKIENIKLSDVINTALKDLQLTISAKNAKITVVGDLPTLEGDAMLLSLLFRNLVSNSLKYCAETPEIEISARVEAAAIAFKIRDNGIGFDLQNADKIFQPFERLHCKSTYPGTGLGLALCKRIIERHHGKIWVSESGENGSVFNFLLPRQHSLSA